MDEFSQLKAVAMELGLEEDEAEMEVEDFMGAMGPRVEWDHLTSFGGEKQEQEDQVDKFVKEWNKRYSEKGYRARKKWNPHDFGPYPEVEVCNFSNGCSDNETFPNGIEQAGDSLAEEMGLDY